SSSAEDLPPDRLCQPGLEALGGPAPAMDEEVEETRIDQDPDDVSRTFLVEPFAQSRTLAEKVPHDVARPDASLGRDGVEDIAHFWIRAGSAADRLVDRRYATIYLGDQPSVTGDIADRIGLGSHG